MFFAFAGRGTRLKINDQKAVFFPLGRFLNSLCRCCAPKLGFLRHVFALLGFSQIDCPSGKKQLVWQIISRKPIDANAFWAGKNLPLWRKDFPLVVSFSPKAGCTTVLKWFLQQNNLLEDAYAYSNWVHDYREQILYKNDMYKEECLKIFTNNPDAYYIIKVIRNPIDRAVSSYIHYLRWGGITKDWAAVREIDNWKRLNGLNTQKGLSFNQFLTFIVFANRSDIYLDPHFSFQFDAIQDEKVDIFIPLEKLQNQLSTLEKRFFLKSIDISLISESIHNNKPSSTSKWPEGASFFPADHNFQEVWGVPAKECFLDKETISLIKRAYWRDIQAYSDYFYGSTAC